MSFSIRKWLVSIISIIQWVHAVPPTTSHLGVVWMYPMGEEGTLTVLKMPTFICQNGKIKKKKGLHFKVKVQTDATQSLMCRQAKLQNTQNSSTRVDWFGQLACFHIWSYSAVWTGDNEAGPFQHSWHFDREWDIHCWDSVVREWCHAGEPKRSRCGVKYSSLCPSSSGYDPNSLRLSGTHIDGTVRRFGLKFPPNGKYYVCEWVQRTKRNEKLQSLLLQSHQAGLLWRKMKRAESCSHSYTCLLLDRCTSVCIFFCLLVANKPKLTWPQSSSEASQACLDSEVTAMKVGQASIITTDTCLG